MNKNLKYFLLGIMLVLFYSCEKELLESNTVNDRPVVEAYLVPGENTTVSITRLVTYADDTSDTGDPITGLDVYLKRDGESYLLDYDSGIYRDTEDAIGIMEKDTIDLAFVFGDDTLRSRTFVPEKPEGFTISDSYISRERIEAGEMPFGMGDMETIEMSWENPDNDFYLVVIRYMEEEQDFINGNMEEMDIEFSNTTSSEPVQGDRYDLRPMEINFFGHYEVILYHVNQEYADLYESVSQNSNDLTNPLSNIENGWGIFTGVNADTLYFQVGER